MDLPSIRAYCVDEHYLCRCACSNFTHEITLSARALAAQVVMDDPEGLNSKELSSNCFVCLNWLAMYTNCTNFTRQIKASLN